MVQVKHLVEKFSQIKKAWVKDSNEAAKIVYKNALLKAC